MAVSANLETIVSHGLCAGCGLCESLTGSDKVEMRITAYGRMRPQVKLALDDTLMDTILDVCPGIKVTGPVQAQLDDHGVMHDIWGPIRSISRGWSTDAALRFYSAAGGAMTASACYLLETGRIDAVVHVRDSLTSPMETDALVSRNLEEVRFRCTITLRGRRHPCVMYGNCSMRELTSPYLANPAMLQRSAILRKSISG